MPDNSLPYSTSLPKDSGIQEFPRAQIVEGAVEPDGPATKYTSPDGGNSLFTDYIINCRYESDKHVYMLPLATSRGFQGNKAAFVQLAASTLLWICDWTSCRWLKKRKVPVAKPINKFWVLLDEHLEPGMITVGPDGTTPLYRLSGTYIWGCTDPDSVTISHPLPPTLIGQFDRAVSDDQFIIGLVATPGSFNRSIPTPGNPGHNP